MYGGQIHFLAALATLHQDNLKKGMNSSCSSYRPDAIHPILHVVKVQLILFFKSSWCKIASAARNKINSAPPSSSADLCLLFCLNPSSMELTVEYGDSECPLGFSGHICGQHAFRSYFPFTGFII